MKILLNSYLNFKSNSLMSPILSNSLAKNTPKTQTNESVQSQDAKTVTFPQVSAQYNIQQNKAVLPQEAEMLINSALKADKEIQQLALEAQKEANKQLGEISENYKKGEEIKNNITTRKITKDNNKETMEEFSPDGKKLLRRSTFINRKIDRIDIDVEKNTDGSEKISKIFYFDEDKLMDYCENCLYRGEQALQEGKRLGFFNNIFCHYIEGRKEIEGDSWKQDKTAIFENGKIISYEEGSSNLKNGTETIKRYVRFNDKGEVYKVIFDYNQTTTAQKCFELKDKGWENITNERVYLL